MTEKLDWQHQPSKEELLNCLSDDALFDELLSVSLKPLSPPDDFSARVMAAISDTASEAAQPAPKIIHFPWRRFAMGIGTCAAALALFIGISAGGGTVDTPTLTPAGKPLQMAQELTPPVSTTYVTEIAPEPTEPVQPIEQTTAADKQTDIQPAESANDEAVDEAGNKTVNEAVDNATDNATEQAPAQTEELPLPVQSDELILPRVAYGTETEGVLSARLIATVDGNRLYHPAFAGRNAVFNTADDTNAYTWRVNLSNPSEPDCGAVALLADLADPGELLSPTTNEVDATTLVTSPDKTMLAQNSADGVWISLLDGDVFKLTNEGKGSLLVWAPDSSKLVFTNAAGELFVGYPMERRIYSLAESGVKDVCWHSDSKTLLYVIDNGSSDSLYMIETY